MFCNKKTSPISIGPKEIEPYPDSYDPPWTYEKYLDDVLRHRRG